MHLKTKTADLNEFKIFCKGNVAMPYQYKKKVPPAAILFSLVDDCESLFTDNLKQMENLYISALKFLLGVRETTKADVVLMESGIPTLQKMTKKRSAAFMKKCIN